MDGDAELAERLRAGDAAAFRAVYARYEGRVHRFLARLSNDTAAADDLVQETWLAFARNASKVEPTGDLAPLLFTIARNKFLNWRRWALLDWSRIELLKHEPEPRAGEGPEASDAREELAAIEAALSELPTVSREVLLLVGVEGMEPAQAAVVLGILPDAARQRLARARAQLTERLERRRATPPLAYPHKAKEGAR